MTVSDGGGFVVSRREHRESDLLLELLLHDGNVARAIAHGGARSVRRFAGGLSPFVLFNFRFAPRVVAGLHRLEEATIQRAFGGVLEDLRRSAAAGAAAAIARELAHDAERDARMFDLYSAMLTSLESADARASGSELVRFAIGALRAAGHPFVLDRCVRCGRSAPDRARVQVSPAAGGVVCTTCGGGASTLSSAQRRALRGVIVGEADRFDPTMLHWVASSLEPHAPRASDIVRRASAHWPA